MHQLSNFKIFEMAIRATDVPDRDKVERQFAACYQHAAETRGLDAAEALANAEARYWLHQIEPEGAAYLKSHLR